MYLIAATGILQRAVTAGLAQHAGSEETGKSMVAVAERITQLGGVPDFDPQGLASRSASQYSTGPSLVDMIRENLIAERIAVQHYSELARYFAEDDPTTRRMIEWILSVEEEHADDMHDLLVAHEGRPMLAK